MRGNMMPVNVDVDTVVWIVRVNNPEQYNNCPYDGVYGYDPIIFAAHCRAEYHAELLSESGDWPAGQPTYWVEETTLGALRDSIAMEYGVDILPE